MIYTVEQPDKSYLKYSAPGVFPPTGQFRVPHGKPIKGMFPPSQYLPLLPNDAVPLGAVDVPEGVLAVMPGTIFEGLPEPVKKWGPAVALGVLAGWLTRKFWRN